MKYIAALGAVIVVGGGIVIVLNTLSVETATNDQKNTHEVKEVVTEVTVDVLQERVQAAQDAARPDIEAKAQEAYQKHVESELEAIRQQVTADYIAELEETITHEDY